MKIKNYLLYSICCSALWLGSCHTPVKEGASQENAPQEEVNAAEKLTIVANITVLPEFKDELLPAIEAVVEATRREAGNISYDVFEDTSNPLKFTFIEHWKSQGAIDAHNASEHFLQFTQAVADKASIEAFILKQTY
ncbi:MAG: antibiotic biosynthesis monooxygenase [Tannerellaceae bacterium]|jgi:quinol monooxygenase YgiN|nr:antibiotic biosynthesis monooxygenase [Tannerellaceae bacterium]